MSTNINGDRSNITSFATLTVTNATNASPIVITTSASHSLATNDWVEVISVGGNTAANGYWKINVLSGTTFQLVGSTGNGAYTSGGAAIGVSLKPQIQIPADGDDLNAASVSAAFQGLADRTQYLMAPPSTTFTATPVYVTSIPLPPSSNYNPALVTLANNIKYLVDAAATTNSNVINNTAAIADITPKYVEDNFVFNSGANLALSIAFAGPTQLEILILTIPSCAVGDILHLQACMQLAVFLQGTSTATVQFEVSQNGGAYVPVAAPVAKYGDPQGSQIQQRYDNLSIQTYSTITAAGTALVKLKFVGTFPAGSDIVSSAAPWTATARRLRLA